MCGLRHCIVLMNRDVEIFIPPPRSLSRAGYDCGRCDSVGGGVVSHRRALATLDALFASLQQRAFAGEL